MVKRREFLLLNLPSVGMRDVLVVPAKDEKVQFDSKGIRFLTHHI